MRPRASCFVNRLPHAGPSPRHLSLGLLKVAPADHKFLVATSSFSGPIGLRRCKWPRTCRRELLSVPKPCYRPQRGPEARPEGTAWVCGDREGPEGGGAPGSGRARAPACALCAGGCVCMFVSVTANPNLRLVSMRGRGVHPVFTRPWRAGVFNLFHLMARTNQLLKFCGTRKNTDFANLMEERVCF